MNLEFRLAIPDRGWKIPCARCETVVVDGDGGIEIEKQSLEKGFQDDTPLRFLRVWHKECRNIFLKKGKHSLNRRRCHRSVTSNEALSPRNTCAQLGLVGRSCARPI